MSTDFEKELSPEELLGYTQGIRRRMAAAIMGIEMQGDGKVPNDPDQQRILLTTLSDIDKTTLTVRKLESEVKQGDADRQAGIMIAKLMSRANLMGNVFEQKDFVEGSDVRVPEHPAILFEGDISPAELEQGMSSLNYAGFKAEYEK